eukprot:1507027-Karenia_brevis.AAC.1
MQCDLPSVPATKQDAAGSGDLLDRLLDTPPWDSLHDGASPFHPPAEATAPAESTELLGPDAQVPMPDLDATPFMDKFTFSRGDSVSDLLGFDFSEDETAMAMVPAHADHLAASLF